MCYSVEAERELRKITNRFHAELSFDDEVYFQDLKARAQDLTFVKEALALTRKPSSNPIKEPGEDGKIFPGYFTPVLIQENGTRILKRMRYRVRPARSTSEIPSQYNVFNARLDSLLTRQTWRPLLMKNHGLLPFRRFYEWVEWEGKKRHISFAPKDRDLMWAPCLYDVWENKEKTFKFYSFAIITDDPPPEVLKMGHDRCPIFLEEKDIDQWLNPQGKKISDILTLLKRKEKTFYEHQWSVA